MLTFIDICSGIGGFRCGLEEAGLKCIGYIEHDKFARKTYETLYDTSEEWTAWDLYDVESQDIPYSDLWCFGFPCQDISLAGSQKGIKHGKRSSVFYKIIELLKGKNSKDRPEWLLIENVKNLLSLHGGEDFTEVLSEISEAGYDAEWHLINSKDYGVPQNRERVFIIGHLRGRGGKQVFPISRASEQVDRKKSEKQIINPAINNKHNDYFVNSTDGITRALLAHDRVNPQSVAIPKQIISGSQAHKVYDSDGIAVTQKAVGGGLGAKTGLYTVLKGDHFQDYVQHSSGNSRTLTARDYKDPQKVAIPVLTPNRINKRQNGRRFKENGEPMFTLTVQDQHGVLIHKDQEHYIRRLTPKECFRLQGFSDEQFERAEKVNSNTQLYKQAGNAVTVNVSRFLGNLLMEVITND